MRNLIWIILAAATVAACNDSSDALEEQQPLVVRTSAEVVGITDRSAVVSAVITGSAAVTARGIYYSPEAGFDVTESTLHAEARTLAGNSFTAALTGLEARTRYHARAYAVAGGELVLGNEVVFTSAAPGTANPTTLGEASVADISPTRAVVSCSVLSGDGTGERGVCYSTAENPTVEDTKIPDTDTGLGAFSVVLDDLTDKTTYYARAYAQSAAGTAYSQQIAFTARFVPKEPKVVFAEETVSEIGFTSGSIAIRITDDGGEEPAQYGVCYGTDPEAIDTKFVETVRTPDAEGRVTVTLTGLIENTEYYLRAYASNSTGTGYSEQVVRFHTAIDGGNGLVYHILPPLRVTIDGAPADLEFLDRNLGAERVATEIYDHLSYGWLFQWGRRADGHQQVVWSSPTKGAFRLGTAPNADAPEDRTTADDTPFYLKGAGTVDWVLDPRQATAADYSLNCYWAAKREDPAYATGGTNNPCPRGFRIPTATEWTAVTALVGKTAAAEDVFALLAIPAAGYVTSAGVFTGAGATGKNIKTYLWASDSGTGRNVTNNNDEKYGGYVMFTTGKAVRAMDKAAALSVRCVRIRENNSR